MKEHIAGMKHAKRIVDACAEKLVGNLQKCGRRDPQVYEQGIGCERASNEIRLQIEVLEKKLNDKCF